MEEIKKEVAEMIDKSVDAKVSEQKTQIEEQMKSNDEALKSLKQEVEDLKKDNAEKTETIKSLGEKMKEAQVKPVQMSVKARRALYKEALKSELKKNLAEIKDMKSTNVNKAYALQDAIEKAAATVLRANVTDGDGNSVYNQYSPIAPGVLRVQ